MFVVIGVVVRSSNALASDELIVPPLLYLFCIDWRLATIVHVRIVWIIILVLQLLLLNRFDLCVDSCKLIQLRV